MLNLLDVTWGAWFSDHLPDLAERVVRHSRLHFPCHASFWFESFLSFWSQLTSWQTWPRSQCSLRFKHHSVCKTDLPIHENTAKNISQCALVIHVSEKFVWQHLFGSKTSKIEGSMLHSISIIFHWTCIVLFSGVPSNLRFASFVSPVATLASLACAASLSPFLQRIAKPSFSLLSACRTTRG